MKPTYNRKLYDILRYKPDILIQIIQADARKFQIYVSSTRHSFIFVGTGVLSLPDAWRAPIYRLAKGGNAGERWESGSGEKKEKTTLDGSE